MSSFHLSNLRLGWILEFLDDPIDDADPFRFWSGDGDLTLDGVIYKGTNGVLSLDAPREGINEATRLRAVMEVTDKAIREQLSRDVGPLVVQVKWIYHKSGQSQWSETGKVFQGRLSSPSLSGAQYTINVESIVADIDRGRVLNWSNDTQKARIPPHDPNHPDFPDDQYRLPTDQGFEYLTELAEGIETKWPP